MNLKKNQDHSVHLVANYISFIYQQCSRNRATS